ncbi:MAG: antibiotic biosynthesis monooxygenase [Rhodoferax sp.]|nr:antibiotic biosynthesis monooxygenase [Rhodoferax sp.]
MNSPALPQAPYYAVIFSSQRNADTQGYDATAERMEQLARQQPGFLGRESSRDANGFGIPISYWTDEASIAAWKAHAQHRIAQETGRERWYAHYTTRVAKVERAYAYQRTPASAEATP